LNFNLKNSLWAVAFFLVALTWYFGLKIDLTGDSGLYAAISRQMVESGNWFDLKINDRAYDQKPHLFFWLAGLGIELFGNTNFAFKLFLFLFGIMGIYFTYLLARLLFSETAGRLAALFTGTSQMFFLYFLDIHTDTVLQSAVILSLWQLAEYMEQKKPVNFLIAFTGIGLAMLTKGPVGAVLPFFFVLFYLLQKKDYRQLVHPKWLAGIVWVLLIISPTLYHLWKSFGAEGLRFYFIDNNIGRVSGEVAGSSTELFFYTYNLLWAFLPWTVPVIAGLAAEIKTWITDRNRNKYNASLLGSVVVLFSVYSIARGKAPNYLMMLMPPLAVVAAGRIQEFVHWSAKLKKGVIYFHYFLLAILVLLLFASWYFVIEGEGTGLLILLIVTSATLSLFFFRNEHGSTRRTLFITLLISAAFNLFQNTMVITELFRYQGARQAIHYFEKDEAGEKQLYNWDLEEYGLFFMAEDSVRNIADWEQMHEAMEKPGTWLYTNEGKHDEIVKMGFEIDTVYRIEQRGMNSISFDFLYAKTRKNALEPNFLIKTEDNFR
jgi:4-amino-4-deoxy-L-arabinose transferase-like glycosyltransferase